MYEHSLFTLLNRNCQIYLGVDNLYSVANSYCTFKYIVFILLIYHYLSKLSSHLPPILLPMLFNSSVLN